MNSKIRNKIGKRLETLELQASNLKDKIMGLSAQKNKNSIKVGLQNELDVTLSKINHIRTINKSF